MNLPLRMLVVCTLGAAGHLLLLAWSSPGADDASGPAATLLLAQTCGFVVVSVLYAECPWGRQAGVFQVLLGYGLAILTVSAWGALFVQQIAAEADYWFLIRLHGLQALPLIALSLGRRLLSPLNTGGLEVLIVGMALLMAPFLMDGSLAQARDVDAAREAVDTALSLSSWSVVCREALELDLLKVEGIYRTFRAGEQLYRQPRFSEFGRLQAILGILLLSTACLGGLMRRLVGQIWTPRL